MNHQVKGAKIIQGMHERGASMVEYALLVILIAIVAFVAVALAGNQLSTTYSEIASGVASAGS